MWSIANTISNPATVRRGEYNARNGNCIWNWDQQLKTTLCVCESVLLYQTMGNASQKPQSINTKEKRKSDWNTTLKMVTKPQEKRKNDEEKKKTYKNKPKTIKNMLIRMYIYW